MMNFGPHRSRIRSGTGIVLVAAMLLTGTAAAGPAPVSLQFLHPIATPADPDRDATVRLSLLWGRSGTVKALDLGLIATGNSGDAKGLQLVGLYGGVAGDLQGFAATAGVHLVQRDVRGLQFSGLAGWTRGHVSGGQASAFVNYAGEGFRGIQISSLVNFNDGDGGFLQLATVSNVTVGGFGGLQLAAFINHANGEMNGGQASILNYADDAEGVQVGVLNFAREMNGLQLGVFNRAQEMKGIPVGLINLVPDEPRAWIFHATTLSLANIGFRSEVNGWTSIISGGYGDAKNTSADSGTMSWHYGRRLGDDLGVDVGWVHIIPSATGPDRTDEDRLHYALQARFTGEFYLGKTFGFWAAAGVSTVFDRYASDAGSETNGLLAGGVVLR